MNIELRDQISKDPKYRLVLNDGFVGVVDHMGSDKAIVDAARVSYGSGTSKVSEDRHLLRYLMRHYHTSPFEMCEVKFHIRLPIFVMRQLVRHRTSNLNEYSARYSILSDDMYIPDLENILPQSDENNQGRAGEISLENKLRAQEMIKESVNSSFQAYRALLGPYDKKKNPDGLSTEDLFNLGYDNDFGGVARELARVVMPVSGYTELYWKQDLNNLFHLFRLRMDPHAQWEIQEFARAMYELVKPLYPNACEAFEDYRLNSSHNSRMENNLLRDMLKSKKTLDEMLSDFGSDDALITEYGLSKRELKEFRKKWA